MFLNDPVQRYNATPGQDFTINVCATNFGNANIGNGRNVAVKWWKDGVRFDVVERPDMLGGSDYSFNNVTDELTISTYDAFEHNGTYTCVVSYQDKMGGTTNLSRQFDVSIDGK